MILALLLVALVGGQEATEKEREFNGEDKLFKLNQLRSSLPPPQVSPQNQNIGSNINPVLYSIDIHSTILYPPQEPDIPSGCFRPIHKVVQSGQKITVKGNAPFLFFFRTSTSQHYYNLEYPLNQTDRVLMTNLMQSTKTAELQYKAQLALNMSCNFIGRLQPHIKMKANVHIDFEYSSRQHSISFPFLLVCAEQKEVYNFNNYHMHGYILFFVAISLALQIYHGYPRDRGHLVAFLFYLLASTLVQNRIASYFIVNTLFMTVALKQWKERRISTRVLSLYIMLSFFIFILSMYAIAATDSSVDWNLLTIAIDNFCILNATMFMALRFIKLSRLRHVFWYFVAVSIFSLLYQGNPNQYFSINFENVFDLSCIRKDLFFPLMMLPISNYFASMTWWMHRVIALSIATTSLLPLSWAIKIMAGVFVAVLAFQIRKNSLDAIKHKY